MGIMHTNCSRVIGAAALAVVSQGAFAADMGIPGAAFPVVIPGFNWTGFYVGAHGGYGSGTIGQFKPQGGFGGAQIGYNYQIYNFVLGIELDAAGAGLSQTLNPSVGFIPVSTTVKNDGLATLRARLGGAVGPVLIYGTAGSGAAHGNASVTALGLSASGDATHSGWSAGGGVEWAFQPNWTTKIEYIHYGLGSANYPLTGAANVNVQSGKLQIDTVK
jgi:outer membrane immunogenic protein